MPQQVEVTNCPHCDGNHDTQATINLCKTFRDRIKAADDKLTQAMKDRQLEIEAVQRECPHPYVARHAGLGICTSCDGIVQ